MMLSVEGNALWMEVQEQWTVPFAAQTEYTIFTDYELLTIWGHGTSYSIGGALAVVEPPVGK